MPNAIVLQFAKDTQNGDVNANEKCSLAVYSHRTTTMPISTNCTEVTHLWEQQA